jgi:hypothetical protein
MSPHKDEVKDTTSAPAVAVRGAVMGDGSAKAGTATSKISFPRPPKFEDPLEERDYVKGRLAAAFRIFGKFGFDEGVAGHITVRVRSVATLDHDISLIACYRIQLTRTHSGLTHLV